MPRYCKLCTFPDQAAVRAAFATDASDRDLAQRFGVSHMAIGRHRRQHIVKPMQAAVAALDRGRTDRQQRADKLAAIEQGDPVASVTAALGIEAQAAKLERIESRLERMAASSEAGGSATSVAALSAQQFKGIETGARLAGVGGFAPVSAAARVTADQLDGKFAVNIIFSTGQTTAINTDLDAAAGPVIDTEHAGFAEHIDHVARETTEETDAPGDGE